MNLKVILCLMLLAIVPFSHQNGGKKGQTSEDFRTRLEHLLAEKGAECGNKSDQDVRKLALRIPFATNDKEKLRKEWMDLINCLAEIKTISKKLDNYDKLKKEMAAAEARDREIKALNDYAADLKKIEERKKLDKRLKEIKDLMAAEAAKKIQADEELKAMLKEKQANCEKLSDEEPKKKETKGKSEKNEKSEKKDKNDKLVCLEEVKMLKEQIAKINT